MDLPMVSTKQTLNNKMDKIVHRVGQSNVTFLIELFDKVINIEYSKKSSSKCLYAIRKSYLSEILFQFSVDQSAYGWLVSH